MSQQMMTTAQWDVLCEHVADAMKQYTRPFVTSLVANVVNSPPEYGTGSYIEDNRIRLLTCEHVTYNRPLQHEFYGCNSLLPDPGIWAADQLKDVASADISAQLWASVSHQAKPVLKTDFALVHAPAEKELLFFRGLAGENAYLGYGGFDKIITGYCSQEKPGGGDNEIFEILWNPPLTRLTSGTDSDTQSRVKVTDPAGFSGSLVWNTRFVESGCDVNTWTPQMAKVTGLLRRWDTATATLLAWRVEHLLAWL